MPLNSPGVPPDSIGPSVKSKTYATVGSDVDLVTEGGGPCRRIRTGGAGNLSLVYPGGVTDVISDCVAGESFDVQASKLVSATTTATKVTVFW